MLVLTRKKSETIQIGNNILIKVISTGRGKVKIGIEAPANVRVLRAEIQEALEQHAQRDAADERHAELAPHGG